MTDSHDPNYINKEDKEQYILFLQVDCKNQNRKKKIGDLVKKPDLSKILKEKLSDENNCLRVPKEVIANMTGTGTKYMLVPSALMEIGYVQEQIMLSDMDHKRKFHGVLEHEGICYYVYLPAHERKDRLQAIKGLWDIAMGISFGRIITIILSYFALFEFFVFIHSLIMEDSSPIASNSATSTLITALSLVLGLLGTDVVQAMIKYRRIVGYWIYYNEPKVFDIARQSETENDVHHEMTRLVRTKLTGDTLYVQCYRIIGGKCSKLSSSKVTEMQYLDVDKKSGILFYWFKGANVFWGEGSNIDGFCALQWDSSNGKVDELKGWYAGIKSRCLGKIHFRRCSKKEFYSLINIDVCCK